jgi:hypothetical protein
VFSPECFRGDVKTAPCVALSALALLLAITEGYAKRRKSGPALALGFYEADFVKTRREKFHSFNSGYFSPRSSNNPPL